MMDLLTIALLSVAAAAHPCALSDADKRANSALSFEEFDQRGALPSSARALGTRGCMREAADASEDWLLRGPARTDREQRIVVWHMAQALAMTGRERDAARLMAASRTPDGVNERLDWDSYVTATWAFLMKDRAVFDAAAARLGASDRPPDRVNGAIVAALGRCWNRPYREAYDADCGR